MNPAFSVILLTTLIGAGQGLFAALFVAELAGQARPGAVGAGFFALGGGIAVALTLAGLVASVFHLGRPERAWRAATMWRTSWLSREVIVLPLFAAGAFFWSLGHALQWGTGTSVVLGALTALACIALFVCTAMIYASIRFLQEWASPLTLVNYSVLGLASGCTLATALAALAAPTLVSPFGGGAELFTVVGLATRGLSLARNARLTPRSSLRTAIGIRHPVIRQRSMGFMGGSFGTREFFHGKQPGTLRQLKWAFLVAAFVLPLLLLAVGMAARSTPLLATAFAVQYLGLLVERWFFFAQANHPQNLYYQVVS
jgi:DMSO reductase anchor subunit